ncbi:MAG: hypothetical protein WC310_03075 [Patescibacteria group bacterium]|jgi:hypothetical protein
MATEIVREGESEQDDKGAPAEGIIIPAAQNFLAMVIGQPCCNQLKILSPAHLKELRRHVGLFPRFLKPGERSSLSVPGGRYAGQKVVLVRSDTDPNLVRVSTV